MKTTKRALFSSVMALILCFSMLVGTTFAWFTDEVKSDLNKIVAGNLDVDVVTTADGVSIENQPVLFDEIKLWEPGVVAYENITVKNLGTLALKYHLSVNFNNENYVKLADGTVTEYSLANVLRVAIVKKTLSGTREEVLAAAGEGVLLSELVETGVLLPEDFVGEKVDGAVELSQDYGIIIWWPQSANDNNWNIQNGKTTTDGKPLHINLGLKLYATQVEGEFDSFDKDYDQPAPIVSAPIARPENPDKAVSIKGAEDVVITLPKEVIEELPDGVEEIGMSVSEPVVDTTNNTITFDSIELVDQDGNVIDLESLNLAENITVTLPLPAGAPFQTGDTVIVYHDGEYMASATVANGMISYQVAHLCEVTISAPEAPKEEDGIVKIGTAAELFGLAQQVNSGKEYYAGKTVVLTADIDLTNAEWTPIGSAAQEHGFMGNFDGKGYTISNLTINNIKLDSDDYAYAGLFGVTEGAEGAENVIKDLTIKNVTINTTGHIVAAAIAYPYYTTVKNITVCGDIAITGGNYTSGVLAYTRRCVNASNLTISGNKDSYITGAVTVGGVISDIQMNGGLKANYSNFSASGLTITGNKNVGGISGIIGGQTLNGANVKNVALVCSDAHVGIVSGAFDSKPVINDATYENVTGATAVAGVPYDSSKAGALVLNGETYVSVSTADELVAALEAGNNVLFINNIKIDPANMSNAYGKTGINVKYGQTIDGNGYTLNIKGAGGTWDSGINTTGGLIKNLTVTGSFRGIFINHTSDYSEKVVLENVVIGGNGTVYTISCDQGLYQGIEATNCTFNGWTSFAKTAGEAKFVNCSFGEGSGYKYCRPYSDTEFVNCTFSEGYAVDMTQATVTFTNCKVTNNGVEYAYVDSADELNAALAEGGGVMLAADITLTKTLMATKDVVIDLNGKTITAPASGAMFQSQSNAKPSMIITSSKSGAKINAGGNSVLLGYGSTEISNVTINVENATSTSVPFSVYGNLTLGEGTVVNVKYLGTALISNNGAVNIVIDGAKINIGTFKVNGTAIITLNNASTLVMENTDIKVENFVLSSFGGDSLVSKTDGVTIENCTFDVTDSNGASCTFEAVNGKYRLVQN